MASRSQHRRRSRSSSRERSSYDDQISTFSEHQLSVFQKALKEQIVQSDQLIKAVYRFSDCIDMTEKAMRALHDVMGDYWEDDWPGAEQYYTTLQDQEQLWDSYEQSMRKLLDPIRQYEDQFEEAEDKMEEFQALRRRFQQAHGDRSEQGHLEQKYYQLTEFLGHGLPKIIASRVPFMQKLFHGLSDNLLQFCLETCKVQSKSCSTIKSLQERELTISLGGEGGTRYNIHVPAPDATRRATSAVTNSPEVSRLMEVVRSGDAEMPNSALLDEILEADSPGYGQRALQHPQAGASTDLRPVDRPARRWGQNS